MPRISERNVNGEWKYLEGQSSATEGTLVRNAVAAGLDPAEVREREVDEAEWGEILVSLRTPTRDAKPSPLVQALDAAVADVSVPSSVRAVFAALRAERVD